jgi:hypothetical protein
MEESSSADQAAVLKTVITDPELHLTAMHLIDDLQQRRPGYHHEDAEVVFISHWRIGPARFVALIDSAFRT